jgi:hypothetical protein
VRELRQLATTAAHDDLYVVVGTSSDVQRVPAGTVGQSHEAVVDGNRLADDSPARSTKCNALDAQLLAIAAAGVTSGLTAIVRRSLTSIWVPAGVIV